MKVGNCVHKIQILTTCIFLLCAGSAHSAMVHLAGTTVDFYYDDSQAGMMAYGTLTAVGDSIFATPTDFFAESNNGGTNNFAALGTITVVVKSGYQFNAAAVAQQGDYIVNGAGSSVSAVGDLTVEDSNNAATNEAITMLNTGLGNNDGLLHDWSAFGQFDLSTATWDNVSSIDLSLDSMLSASTTSLGESAKIQNKLIAGGLVTIETTVIPVPAAVWLFVSGLLGLVTVVRRKH